MFDVMTVATTTQIHPSSSQKVDALIIFNLYCVTFSRLRKRKTDEFLLFLNTFQVGDRISYTTYAHSF